MQNFRAFHFLKWSEWRSIPFCKLFRIDKRICKVKEESELSGSFSVRKNERGGNEICGM